MSPGPFQILIIILLVFILFGANRIPDIMENLAKGINSFKKGLREGDEDIKRIGSDSDAGRSASSSAKQSAKAEDDA